MYTAQQIVPFWLRTPKGFTLFYAVTVQYIVRLLGSFPACHAGPFVFTLQVSSIVRPDRPSVFLGGYSEYHSGIPSWSHSFLVVSRSARPHIILLGRFPACHAGPFVFTLLVSSIVRPERPSVFLGGYRILFGHSVLASLFLGSFAVCQTAHYSS